MGFYVGSMGFYLVSIGFYGGSIGILWVSMGFYGFLWISTPCDANGRGWSTIGGSTPCDANVGGAEPPTKCFLQNF